jgi:anti-sigma regulatory factor (Ser/Thr protein kinase)
VKPPTQRTVALVRPTDSAPTQQPSGTEAEHGDGAQAVVPGVPVSVPDDAPFKLSAVLTWPLSGETARNLVLGRLRKIGWGGDQDAAGRVADVLATNAAAHAARLDCDGTPLRLVILPNSQLLIEVDDGTPDFPDFDKVVEGAPAGCGLWWVSQYRGRLTHYPLLGEQGETVGKTVQVLLPVSREEVA